MTLEEERRDLYRAISGALGHERPGGPHNHLNAGAFLSQLERFIDAKIEESNRAKYPSPNRAARTRS